jgi:hypothetical protein
MPLAEMITAPLLILIELHRLLRRPHEAQIGEMNGHIAGEVAEALGLFVKQIDVAGKDPRGLDGQRAVDVDMLRSQRPAVDEPIEPVEQILGALHGKGGNDDVTPTAERVFDDAEPVAAELSSGSSRAFSDHRRWPP